MNKAAKCDFPGISDDQAEGCHILFPESFGQMDSTSSSHFRQL